MGMKEDNDEVTTKTRILSLELLQVNLMVLSVLVCMLLIDKHSKNLNKVIRTTRVQLLSIYDYITDKHGLSCLFESLYWQTYMLLALTGVGNS